MQLYPVLFILFGAVALGAAVAAVALRNALYATASLGLSSLGVAGLLALLDAPILAVMQVLLVAGGSAALIRFAPASFREMACASEWGGRRLWWMTVLLATALGGVICWTVLQHPGAEAPGPVPSGSVAVLGAGLVAADGFILPLAASLVLLGVTSVGVIAMTRSA
jgi:NADH-quinone oxidoreductase subunit J